MLSERRSDRKATIHYVTSGLVLTCILVVSLEMTSAAEQRGVYTEGQLLEDAANRSVHRHTVNFCLLLHWSVCCLTAL